MGTALGYIGLGIMGGSMARNLLEAGHELAVFNRTRSRTEELAGQGATVHDSPAALAEAVDVVFTNVTDDTAVEAVVLGPGGVIEGARPGSIVVDNSTISPGATQRIAARLAERDIGFLDAPVSGGDVGAREGTLTIMCGGEEEAFDSVKPFLEVMGTTIRLMGPVGMGQATKACNQVLCAVNMIGCCEAIALANRLGLDVDAMLEVVSAGAGGSWALANLGPKIAAGDLAPGFMVRLIQKDLDIVLDEARRGRLPLPGTALAQQLFRGVEAEDKGDLGTQAMILAVEKLGNFRLNR